MKKSIFEIAGYAVAATLIAVASGMAEGAGHALWNALSQ